MKKRTVIAVTLLILLTTITSNQKISVSKFKLKEINVENNFLIKEEDIKKSLEGIYGKNLFFIKNEEIKNILTRNSLVEGFKITKRYPNKLRIKIFEKKPIAILVFKKEKFYLSDKIELIEFKDINNYQELPYVFGSRKDFNIFYNELRKINFPIDKVEKFTFYENGRWDLKTINNRIIKLPPENYIKSLKNYLTLVNKSSFKKFNIFDYRINNQLILK